MLVLHAGRLGDEFFVWGEAPPEPEGAESPPRGRAARIVHADSLPFDAGFETLTAALLEVVPGVSVRPKDQEELAAWLPTVHGKPVPSSTLVGEVPEPIARSRLEPWSVSAVRLALEPAVDLLAACVGQQTLRPGLIIGKTLAFWTSALRFAGALVARQSYLPGLEKTRTGFRARWEPVLAGAEANRLAQLVRVMPPACRALSTDRRLAPQSAPATIVSAFLNEVVDHLVRSSIQFPVVSALERVERRRATAAMAGRSFASLHDQWVHALQAPDGALKGDTSELAQLEGQVREWRRKIAVATAAPFRLCFRLEEPAAPEDDGEPAVKDAPAPWYVRFLLQATDDPSLLVELEDVWAAKGPAAALLQRGGLRPREFILASLGQAAATCPEFEASLRQPTPVGAELDANGAHEFLTQRAWLLEQAGFGVLLPAWWSRKGTKARLAARANVRSPAMQGGSGMSLEDLVEFRWEVALGDQALTEAELRALAQLKAPLVRVRGQWVQLSAEEIQAALEFWKKRPAETASLRQLVQMALGAAQPPGGLAFEGVKAEGWIANFLDQLEGRASFEELPAPEGFRGTLRPYQVRGYSWLGFLRERGLGACLADDMGLGKTVQTLALIQRDWESNGRGRRPVLLACPMSVVGNWQKEAARFTPDLPVLVHHGMARTKGPTFRKEAMKQAIVLTSFALLHRDFELFKKVPWAGLIVDEAQNIKNPQTKQSQAARTLPADYRIALTGTPVENHVGELWAIMEYLNPGFLGTQADFKRSFFIPIQANRDAEAAERLKRLTGPFLLRRLKTDRSIIADLPDKMEMKVFCTLTREQASLYAAVVEEAAAAMKRAEGIQRKGIVLGTLTKLKQVCNHPVHFLGDNTAIPGRSGKLARLTEMIEETLESDDRTLVFTQFAEMGTIIRRHLQETFGMEALFLHGGVPKGHRDRMVERFQGEADGPRVFVLSLKAGGTGLNLTRANHVFHFDRWWNPAVEDQATDRAFRIGQTRHVQVHKFLCTGTLEEKIDEMIERKKEVAGQIIGSGENWLTELSNEELIDLFTLRREALGE